jgi:Mrp family chromosome partitioning ATPase
MADSITSNGAHANGHIVNGADANALGNGAARHGLDAVLGGASRRGTEPFDSLLWRLQARQSSAAFAATTLGLVGCGERVGVTTLAGNLAVRASELGLGPVLLIEAESARPKLRKSWRLPAGPGLAEWLSGEANYADCVQPGPAADLEVMCASGRSGSAIGWDAGVVDALLAEACADHRLVLFDLAAADKLGAAGSLARRLDQVLLVVSAESTRSDDAQRIADRLREDGVPIIGAVLNRERRYVPRWLSRWM